MKSLRPVLIPVAGVTALCAVVFGILEGLDGVLGALLGGAVVTLFLGSTPLILTPVVKASAALSLPVALGFLATKSLAVLVILVLLFDVGGVGQHIDSLAFGITAIATALSWTLLQTLAFRKERVPIYDLGNSD